MAGKALFTAFFAVIVRAIRRKQILPKIAKPSILQFIMSTMNISLPDALKSYVDEQVSERGYGTSSEYVRELIRQDRDRQQLRGLLLAGAASVAAEPVTASYFDDLRSRVRKGGAKGRAE